MQKSAIEIRGIPAAVWGSRSEKVYIYAHGQGGSKDDAELPSFASKADRLLALTCPGTDRDGTSPLLASLFFMICGALFWNFAKFYRMQRSAGTRSRCLPLA